MSRPQSRLEDRDNALPEQQRVRGVTAHDAPSTLDLRDRTAPTHYCVATDRVGKTCRGNFLTSILNVRSIFDPIFASASSTECFGSKLRFARPRSRLWTFRRPTG